MTGTERLDPTAPPAGGSVVTLDDPAATDPASVGRKAATLARLRAAGFPVMDGVVVPVGDPSTRPADTRANGPSLEIVTDRMGTDPVAVRSSSPVEDGALASAAGQYLTLLRVLPREPDLTDAVSRVRASAGGAPMAVLIQPMIDARAAGVAFGADPVTGDRDAVHISAVRGLADRLVGGSAPADQWTVTDGSARCEHGDEGAITAQQAVEIARLVRELEDHEGSPQDVEWAIDASGLRLVQSRPITALPTPPTVDLPPGTWVSDPNRYPGGMTPFGMSVAAPEVGRGLSGVFDRCGALVERVEVRDVAGRPYLRFVPVGGRSGNPPPGPVLGALTRLVPALRERCRRARKLLASGELDADIADWTSREKQRARRVADELLQVDVTALSDTELAAHLERVVLAARQGLGIHFRLMAPYLVGVYGLVHSCRDLLDWSRGETLAMLAGLSPASDEPTRELAAIAERVAADPAARAAMRDGDGVAERLRAVDPGIGAAFDTWCRTYGVRTANDDPGSPTLLEMPGLLEGLLADQVRQAARRDGGADRAGGRVRARAEQAAGRARAALANRTAADRRRFDDALAAAMAAYPVREDNVLWALSAPSGLARCTAIEIGVRLHARGEIDDPRDVVMLDMDTMLTAARGAAPPGSLRGPIARAKAERAWVALHPLPSFYGPPPGPMPDLRWLPRAARIVNEALQLDAPTSGHQRQPAPGALLTGVPGSSGRHTGPVRIVRAPGDFASLRRGEVLVCSVTDPAWSVLFGIAGAVVTDGGGVLTHSAIIAREHGIPAVLGTGTATKELTDGQLITVDGGRGLVLPADRATPEAP